MRHSDPRTKRKLSRIRKIRSKFPPIIKKGVEHKKPGVSILMIVRDEPWAQPAVKSVSDISDEIILVDSSTEKLDIKKLKSKIGVKIVYEYTEPSGLKQRALAIELSSYRWLLRWDADFIGYKDELKKLRKNLDLGVSDYIATWLNVVDLRNFFYTSSTQSNLCHTEPYLSTYSKDFENERRMLRRIYEWKRGNTPNEIQHPHPLYYEYKYRENPVAMHLRRVKPKFRINEKKFHPQWTSMSETEKKKYGGSLKKYSEQKERPENFNNRFNKQNIEKYKAQYGYPEELEKHLKKIGIDRIENTKKFKEKINRYIDSEEWIL